MNSDEAFQTAAFLVELVLELGVFVLQLLQKALLVQGERTGGQQQNGGQSGLQHSFARGHTSRGDLALCSQGG